MWTTLQEWYRQPFDYEWIIHHRSTRGLHRSLQNMFGAATILYAAASILMLFSARGPQGLLAQAWVGIVLLVQVAVALRWFFGPLPTRRDFIAFAIFGDVGLTSVLVLYEPFGALIGSGLFVVTGALCTYFLSQRWLLAHLAWCVVFVSVTVVRAMLAETEDVPTALAGGLVAIAINSAIPLLAHIAWTAIGRDARRSLLDPLTELLNRRGVEDASLSLISRSHARGHCLVVVVVDIDRFKSVNDYFGHDAGDDVIVTVAHRLKALFAEDGVVARTGGEEFLVVFAGTMEHAHDMVHRIGHTLYRRDDRIPITVSVGAAVVSSPSDLWNDGAATITRATRAADSMMYRAKYDGGNRTASIQL
ncbi:diguanylate cyclase domain-containing protein [Rhodococcus sp. NPDC057297]|uniref:GGDEF domain-containing protein n=1 Tax=Rhodococcus sp. NPDC057297 TaxID=3346090 RepID=UPI00362C1B7A